MTVKLKNRIRKVSAIAVLFFITSSAFGQGMACSYITLNNPQWNNGTNKIFSPCSDVNVGIGLSTPLEKLHVDGNVLVSQRISSTSLKLGTSNSSLFGFLTIETPYNDGVQSNSSIPLNISNADRYLLRLNNSGLLQAREIKVDVDTWPDYVFEKNYELMPLHDVERHIQEEGHLPNIPSAEEIEADGINLGEMDKMLLEKIEELTLHIIEQDKRIQGLENELNK